jgi:hypothetical protein
MAQILAGDARGEYLKAFYYRMNRQVQRSNELLRIAIDEYPADDSLRLDFLRGWFGELVKGNAPPEIAEVAERMNSAPASILTAARHAAKNEWREVAMADAQLAEIPWTHIWYPEALELRVNWRTRVDSAKERKRLADEAILMVDRVAIMNPTLNLFALRLHAGLAAERPEVAVESLSNYARLAIGMRRAGVTSTPVARKDINALIAVLDEVAKLPGADAARIAEVRAEINGLAVT